MTGSANDELKTVSNDYYWSTRIFATAQPYSVDNRLHCHRRRNHSNGDRNWCAAIM